MERSERSQIIQYVFTTTGLPVPQSRLSEITEGMKIALKTAQHCNSQPKIVDLLASYGVQKLEENGLVFNGQTHEGATNGTE